MDNRNGLNLVLPPSSTVAEQAFFQAVSKHLPEWAYLYVAPAKKKEVSQYKAGFPVLYNQGTAHLFIKAKQK